jgi:hypothetical protein
MDVSLYEQTIAKLRDDLSYIEKFKSPFAPVNELNHIENVLLKLEEEITVFRDRLPRLNQRRAVLSAVGSALKWVFGTATLGDIGRLHEAISDMHRTEGEIIHSVNHQMTYLKTLNSAVKFNTGAVETLSEKVKDIMLDSNKWKDETDVAIHWLNYTLYNQSNTFTFVRQLEFAILELRANVKEMLDSLDSTMTGKLSMNLISPTVLKSILKNVTSYFPDGYTLCVSMQQDTINLFYEFLDISVFADHHSIKLVLLLPLKTFERHFYLYKLITFPYKVPSLGSYVQLTAEYENLVLDDSNQRFLLWNEADIRKCKGKNIMVCPVDRPVFSRNVLTCESSLYFQRNEARTLCSRRIVAPNFAPILIQHSRDWIYSLGVPQQVNLKCRQNSTWTTSTWTLHGNGILHNASSCHVTGQDFKLYPATESLSVSTVTYQAELMVQHVEPITNQELQLLQSRSSPNVVELENIAAQSQLFKHQDLDATLLLHATDRKNDDSHRFYWYITIPTVVAVLVTMLICNTYPFFLRTVLYKIRGTKQPTENPTLGKPTQPSGKVFSEEQPSTSRLQSNDTEIQSAFVSYSTHSAA